MPDQLTLQSPLDLPGTEAAPRRAAAPRRYQAFGWFRLLLAAMVLVTHFSQNIASDPIRDALFPLCIAMIGVSCFFVLSGLIIAEAMATFYQGRPVAFLLNRGLRIGPPLVAALVLANLVFAALAAFGSLHLFHGMELTGHRSFGPSNILRNVASLLPLPKGSLAADVDTLPVLWTLRIEFMFYLAMFGAGLLASLAGATRFCRYEQAMPALLLLLGAACLVGTLARAAGHAPDLVTYFTWFGLGVSLFYARQGHRAAIAVGVLFAAASSWQFVAVQVAGRAAYQFNPLLRGQPVHPAVPLVILGACILVLVAVPALQATWFRSLDRMLGNITYPLYLNHVTAGVVVLSFMRPGLAAMLVATVAAFALSCAMDRLIEPISTEWRARLRGASLG